MLSTKEGVKEIKVDLGAKEGVVQFLPNLIAPKDVSDQINDMGFEAYVKTINGKLMKTGKYSDCKRLNNDLTAIVVQVLLLCVRKS